MAALQRQIDLHDTAALAELIPQLELDLQGPHVLLDGVDVTEPIRTPEVTQAVRFVADSLPVRHRLSTLQRRAAAARFDRHRRTRPRDHRLSRRRVQDLPDRLTAERARRRYQEMRARGLDVSEEEILRQQTERDRHDGDRPVGGLEKAEDAIEFCTDGLEVSEVIDQLESLVRHRLSAGQSS